MKLLAISLGIQSGWAFSPDHKKNRVISGTIDMGKSHYQGMINELSEQYHPDRIALVAEGKITAVFGSASKISTIFTTADIRKFATGRKNGSVKRMLAEYRRLFDSEPVNVAEAEAFFALAKLAMSVKGE